MQNKIKETYEDIFGRTPLVERLKDLETQLVKLKRFGEVSDLKQKLGNLLTSTIQCATECGWDIDELVDENLDYIKSLEEHYKPLGRKTRVAIFGGSFSPIHLGHAQFAWGILDAGVVDEVWVIPCNQSRYGKALIPGEHRLEMCRKMFMGDGRIKINDWEIANNTGGETYRLLKEFVSAPGHNCYEFFFAIGLDNAYKASGWVNWDFVERFIPFIVVPRKGVERTADLNNWFNAEPHIVLNEVDIMEASSSDIRKAFKENSDQRARELLSPDVYNYIVENHLHHFWL